MRRTALALAAAAASFTTASAQTPPAAPAPCVSSAGVVQICELRNPEDLVLVPGADWIIASGLAVANQAESGGLVLIDRRRRAAFKQAPPTGAARAPYAAGCAAPPEGAKFSAHGLSIRPVGPNRAELFVVGHGSREAIEVFEVVSTPERQPTISWIGCIPAPAGATFNSVAALADGRVFATDFYHAPTTMADALQGRNTGAVYGWKPGGAWEKVPGTDLPGPNGIEVTPDGRYVFVAVTGSSSIMRYDLTQPGAAPWSMKLDFRADNLRWAPDGRLLLAGPGPEAGCVASATQRCPSVPVVGALDPLTLQLTVIKRGPPDPTFPGTSSALIVGDELWLGSYNADRIVILPLAGTR